MKIVFLTVAALAALFFLTTYICFHLAFYVTKKQRTPKEEFEIPPGKIYEPHRKQMVAWMKEVQQLPCKEFTITAFDGLRLHGKFYEFAPGAPMELMFHGYRGNSQRDLCGGVQRCFSLGRSAFIVDQRTSGKSEGNIISFGINEHQDCLKWVEFLVSHFGEDVKIHLTGISMGASTVLMAAGKPLPPQVIGVVADCGFTSAKAIIQKVIRQMHLPANLLYPFVKWGAKIWGRFDLESYSAIESVKNIKVPVIFAHGLTDDFVPWEMSKENFESCGSEKKHLCTIDNCGHGLAYVIDPERYKKALRTFE